MKLGEIMYKQNQQDTGKQEEQNNPDDGNKEAKSSNNDAHSEDVVDADFEEVKEDKEKKSN